MAIRRAFGCFALTITETCYSQRLAEERRLSWMTQEGSQLRFNALTKIDAVLERVVRHERREHVRVDARPILPRRSSVSESPVMAGVGTRRILADYIRGRNVDGSEFPRRFGDRPGDGSQRRT